MNNFFINRVFVARIVFFVIFCITAIVFVYIIFKILNPPAPKILSYEPLTNSKNQSIFPTINVTFSSSTNKDFQSKTSISSNPKIVGSVLWSEDGKSMLLMPTEPLLTKTKYQITVNTSYYSENWIFTTVDEKNLSEKDKDSLQGSIDFKDAQGTAEFFNSHSWYDQTPIVTENYFIAFLSNTNSFIAYLYPKKASPVSVDDQVVTLKKAATQALLNIGVDANKYTITWEVQPK